VVRTAGVVAGLALLLAWTAFARPLAADPLDGLVVQPGDAADQTDRYQVTISQGDSLWDWARSALPLTDLDSGDNAAYQVILDGYQRAYPDRSPDALQPGDRFTFSVPAGSFVTQDVSQDGGNTVYTSHAGDQLIAYGQPAGLLYRLVSHDHPDQADVRVSGVSTSAGDLARDIYQVDPPDFIQVRTVRGALDDPNQRVHVDQAGRYLDDFRNYRDQATAGGPTDAGLQTWTFAADDTSEPFVRVEDAIGDETDPSAFPTQLRVAFYRDGTVRTYALSEPGDSLEDLEQPDTTRWHTVLPAVAGWQTGVVETIPPFASAVNDAGVLLPDRLLVLRFSPAVQPASSPIPAGLSCAGLPLALVLWGSGLAAGRRARSGGFRR
jgi:hypothetical protein